MRRGPWGWLCALLFTACVPQTSSQSPPTLPRSALENLSQPFLPQLGELGIVLERGSAFALPDQPMDSALPLTLFYQQYTGFCPLEEGGFQAHPTRDLYLTVAARAGQVRLLITDRSPEGGLRYAFLEGHSSTVLSTRRCAR